MFLVFVRGSKGVNGKSVACADLGAVFANARYVSRLGVAGDACRKLPASQRRQYFNGDRHGIAGIECFALPLAGIDWMRRESRNRLVDRQSLFVLAAAPLVLE